MAAAWCRVARASELFVLLVIFFQTVRGVHESSGSDVIPEQHTQGIEMSGEEGYWALTADLRDRGIRCAHGPVTATFVFETLLDIANVTLISGLAGIPANLYFHSTEKVAELELAPRKSQEGCLLEKDAKVTVKVHCPACSELPSTVRYTLGQAIGVGFPPQRLTPANLPPGATQGDRAIRFSTQVDKRLLIKGHERTFTAVFTFSSSKGTKIFSFSPRVRTLLTSDKAYYTRRSPNQHEATVYASLKLPRELDISNPPDIVIDVECQGCNKNEVFLTYRPERTGVFSIRNDAFYHRYFNRKVVEKPARGMEVIAKKKSESHLWQFNVTTAKLCSSVYDGAIFLTANRPWSRADFYWKSGGVRYEATVRQSHQHRLVHWVAKPGQDLCSTANGAISLFMACEDCDSVDVGASCLPLEPQVPQGTAHINGTLVTGSWKENGKCIVSITSNTRNETPRVGDIFKLWVDFPRGSQASDSKLSSPLTYKNKEKVREILEKWEGSLFANPSGTSRSFSNGWQWLCENLKGRVYRQVDATRATF